MSRNQRIRKERKIALIEQEKLQRTKRIVARKRAEQPAKTQERFGTIYPFTDAATLQKGSKNKVFNRFLKYAGPLLRIAADPASVESAVKLAVVCWNFGLLTIEEQEAGKQQFLAQYGGIKELNDTLESMLVRKLLEFGDDFYYIEKYEVTQKDGMTDLSITYKKVEKVQ